MFKHASSTYELKRVSKFFLILRQVEKFTSRASVRPSRKVALSWKSDPDFLIVSRD
jgi:hypothetical protein